jgi:hypothetical protein
MFYAPVAYATMVTLKKRTAGIYTQAREPS